MRKPCLEIFMMFVQTFSILPFMRHDRFVMDVCLSYMLPKDLIKKIFQQEICLQPTSMQRPHNLSSEGLHLAARRNRKL